MYKKLSEACQINCGTRVVQKKDGGTIYPVYGGGGATFKMDTYNREDCLVVARFAMSKQCTRFVKGKFFLNDSGLTVSSNDFALNQNYLDKVIVSLNDNIYNSGKGVAQKNLDMKEFKNLQIPIPPLATQQQIVSELDLLSHILDQKRQQLKEYDALAESIFYDMFGDPVENPKGWEVKMWGDLFETKLGKMLDKNKQRSQDRKLPYLANVNVQWGYFDLTNLKTMTFSQEEESKFEILNGDLLLCEGGEAGRCAIWKFGTTEIKYQKAVHRARPKSKNVEVVYISHFIQKLRERGGLKDYLTKATIEHLTGEKLKKLPIPLPPLDLQRSFAAKIESIEHQKQLLRASIKETEMLFQSRMDYWFNG